MKKLNKLVPYGIGLLGIVSLIYYSIKFYPYLKIEKIPEAIFLLLITVIFVSLVLGLYNCYVVSILKSQNIELLELVKELKEQSDTQCNNVLEATYNSRDIILDTYNVVIKEGK